MLVDWTYGPLIEAEGNEKLSSPIPLEKLRYVLLNLEASADIDSLTKTEYVVCELVRLGKLSLDDINVFMSNFTVADTTKNGNLSIDEMVACGMVVVNPNYKEREAIYGLTPRNTEKNSIRLSELVVAQQDTETDGGNSPSC